MQWLLYACMYSIYMYAILLKIILGRTYMYVCMCVSAVQCLQWLLQKVEEPAIVHSILWEFSAALSDHPVHQMAAKVKSNREQEEVVLLN